MSQLALARRPHVAEAEINPLIVKPEGKGVVAVDGSACPRGQWNTLRLGTTCRQERIRSGVAN